MLADGLWVVVGIVLLAMSGALRPRAAQCPTSPGWLVDGVRPSGVFECLHFREIESDDPPDAVLGGQLYCTGGSRPIVVRERVVGCQRYPGS